MRFAVGLGMPRSGTKSLRRLWISQKNFWAVHEGKPRVPWLYNREVFNDRIIRKYSREKEKGTNFYGEIAFYFLPYVETFLELDPEVRFVCLKREKELVIKSLLWKIGKANPFLSKTDKTSYCKNFPTYSKELCKNEKACIARYYDEYYYEAERLKGLYPQSFKIFKSPEILNTKRGREGIMKWIGYPVNQVNHDIKYRIGKLTARRLRENLK